MVIVSGAARPCYVCREPNSTCTVLCVALSGCATVLLLGQVFGPLCASQLRSRAVCLVPGPPLFIVFTSDRSSAFPHTPYSSALCECNRIMLSFGGVSSSGVIVVVVWAGAQQVQVSSLRTGAHVTAAPAAQQLAAAGQDQQRLRGRMDMQQRVGACTSLSAQPAAACCGANLVGLGVQHVLHMAGLCMESLSRKALAAEGPWGVACWAGHAPVHGSVDSGGQLV